jgi:hypothetical protein
MNPAVAAALLSQTTPAKKARYDRDGLLPSSAPPKLQQAPTALPEAPPARTPEPPILEELRASMPVEALASSLAAMARAQVRLPRPPKVKPKPVVFRPTATEVVAEQVALALEALDGLELAIPKGMTCPQRRWANKVSYAVDAARRELERAKALAK